ncbi:MAG: FecR family protein [Pseudomonadota bacterium]
MIPQPYFKLTRQAVLLGIISAAFPATGYCIAAGRADFVIGKVEALAPNGSRRVLIKGSEINPGDAISTAAGARAQLRFTDGGFVSLQPNTLFRIDEFNYQNKTDGEEKGFFSLLKGGLRAITGAIGHINRGTYRVNTPVATIGIRGTGYNAVLGDGLLVSVGEGAVSLTNNGGMLVVSAGNAGYVANANAIPVPTAQQPQTPPAALQPTAQPITAAQFTAGEERDASGHLVVVAESSPAGLVSGSGYAVAYASLCNGCNNPSTGLLPEVNAIFNNSGQLTEYSNTQQEVAGKINDGTITSSGNDGIIGWGRWDGNTTGTSPHPLDPGVFHYVVGMPTVNMPTAGSATYTMIGATTPSSSDESHGWSVAPGAQLSAYFSNSSPVLYVDSMTISNSTNGYSLHSGTSPLVINNSNSTFSGSVNTTAAAGFSGTSCTSGCTTAINGLFAGNSAARAGLAYSINDTVGPKIQGAAAFSSGGVR